MEVVRWIEPEDPFTVIVNDPLGVPSCLRDRLGDGPPPQPPKPNTRLIRIAITGRVRNPKIWERLRAIRTNVAKSKVNQGKMSSRLLGLPVGGEMFVADEVVTMFRVDIA